MGSRSRSTQANVAREIKRARSLQGKLLHQARLMLQTELAVGMTHVRIAQRSRNRSKISHNVEIARHAYESSIRLSQRIRLRDSHAGQSETDLGKLKAALRELGEKV